MIQKYIDNIIEKWTEGSMSMDSAKAFKARFLEDKEFQKRFLALATADERQSFLHSEGFDFTPEELAQVRQELSDDELAVVAGGKCCGATCEHEPCSFSPCRGQCTLC